MEKNKFKQNKKVNKKISRNSQLYVPSYDKIPISKNRIDSFKLDLTHLSERDFIYNATKYFFDDIIYKKCFLTGELFSLNKSSSYKEITKINLLLEELRKNNYDSPRVIFFLSPPMIGMSYIVRYFNQNNFNFLLFNHTFGVDNKNNYKKYLTKEELYSDNYKDGSISTAFEKIFFIMKGQNNTDNKTFFIVFKNMPDELYVKALNDINAPNFLKNWKGTISNFCSEIMVLLKKERSNVKLIFFTDDKEIDTYDLKTIFNNTILDNNLTKKVICNPIAKRRMFYILESFIKALNPPIIDENNFNSFAESIYLEFNSNLQKILDHLLLTITSEYYHQRAKKTLHTKSQYGIYPRPQSQQRLIIKNECPTSQNRTKNRISNKSIIKNFNIKKEKTLDHDLFRLLGKLLYNKRLVIKNNSIEKLKKEEFGDNSETPRYYNIGELINEIPISFNSFNDLLINNSIEHFNDIEEYSSTYEIYSFTDTIDNFLSYLYDKNNQYDYNNNYMKIYLNCLGITTYNLSQYNDNKKFGSKFIEKGLVNIKKLDPKYNNIKINKFKDQTYYTACEHFPSVISLSLFDFYKGGICDIYKNYYNKKEGEITIKNDDNEDINSFYKANVYKKYLESNEEENNNNKKINNANRSPKTKKLRNIPEEDKKALNSFLNEDDDESETENEIEE